MKQTISAIVLAALGCASAQPQQSKQVQLTGSTEVTGAASSEPSERSSGDHFLLRVTGESAQSMYLALPGSEEEDLCGDSGALEKRVGNVVCRKSSNNQFECTMRVDMKTGELSLPDIC